MEVIQHVRDIYSQDRMGNALDQEVVLRGVVTRMTPMGRIIFLGLNDVSGNIQVVFKKTEFSDEDWKTCNSIAKGALVKVCGKIGKTNKGQLSIFADKLPDLKESELDEPIDQLDLPFRAVGSQIIQSRIIRKIGQELDNLSFVEIEPKYVQTKWAGRGLEPIKVQYPGFGSSAYLAPSPVPQLYEAYITTGIQKLYASGKCFTTSYRDSFSSTEASAIFGIMLPSGETEPYWTVPLEVLANLFMSVQTFAYDNHEVFLSISEWPMKNEIWPPSHEQYPPGGYIQLFENPEILVRQNSSSLTDLDQDIIHSIARLVFFNEQESFILAECVNEERFGSLSVISFTFNTEHLLKVLSATPLRTLRTSTFLGQ